MELEEDCNGARALQRVILLVYDIKYKFNAIFKLLNQPFTLKPDECVKINKTGHFFAHSDRWLGRSRK
jgi:hypothetical protein